MSSLDVASSQTADAEIPRQGAGWKILCISPNRKILEELAPVVEACLPNATVLEHPAYPEPSNLARIFGPQPPAIVLLDVISNRDVAVALIVEIAKSDKGVSTVALLATNDAQLILRCLRQGAAEFMLQPFSVEQLSASIAKIARTLPKEKLGPKQIAKVYCVMPAKGACGASTLASNLAFQVKRSGSGRVLLADLDPLTGTISFLLKARSSYSFVDVLSHAESLDADLWKAMVTARQGVDVLLSPETLLAGASELRDATPIVDFARTAYDSVILDAPSVYGDWNLSQARLCDELLLVTTNELPALQATQRALSYLEANRIGRWKIKVVVNRYDKDIGLSRDVIGTALQTDIFHVVPSDYEAVQKSLLEGKSIPPTSSLGRSLTQLGDRLHGNGNGKKKESAKSNGSALGGLLSLFSRTSS